MTSTKGPRGPQPRAYMYHGHVFCRKCLPVNPWDPDVIPIDAITSWKAIPACHKCGKMQTYVKIGASKKG